MGEYKRGFMLMTRLSKIPANAPIHKRQYKRPGLVMRLLRPLSQLGRIIPGVETQIRVTMSRDWCLYREGVWSRSATRGTVSTYGKFRKMRGRAFCLVLK
jgi:hypothetical protein